MTFLTPAEVAARWKCSPRHVRRLARAERLAGLRIGIDWRFSIAAVEAYETAHTTSAETMQPAPTSAPREGATATAVDGFNLPADYEPVFPDLWLTAEPTKKTALSSN